MMMLSWTSGRAGRHPGASELGMGACRTCGVRRAAAAARDDGVWFECAPCGAGLCAACEPNHVRAHPRMKTYVEGAPDSVPASEPDSVGAGEPDSARVQAPPRVETAPDDVAGGEAARQA
jgi:hypothetical protein